MVVENLQTTPLLEWLLGPGWREGLVLQPWALVGLAALLALAVVWRWRRPGAVEVIVSPRVAGVAGILAGMGLIAIAALAALWHFNPEIGGQSVQDLLGAVGEPLGGLLARLLGPQWYLGSLYHWLLVLACLGAVAFAACWFISALRSGPVEATLRSGRAVVETAVDLAATSPRRVLALTGLAVRESIRRKVVVVFAVFLLLLLFAGFFLNTGSDQPARLYIQFVLTTTGYLVLLLALMLAALSLPADLKDKTLHTIVTKPVRTTEIILGRILGFAVIGSILLAGMGVISYCFTVRGLDHTHAITAADLREEPLPGNQPPLLKGNTSFVHQHQHQVTIDPGGDVSVEIKQGHWHDLSIEGKGGSAVYKLGPPQGMLVARVPVYAKTLRFRDRKGKDVERGINVGDEWQYRSFIEGNSQAAAIWCFEGIDDALFPESLFPDAIPLEMTIEVFRTHKGDVSKPILGSLWLRNPDTGRKVIVRNFLAKKFATDVQLVPRKLTDRKPNGEPETLDLMRDLVTSDGRLEVELQCAAAGQFFGMAQADLYFRARNASFALNFAKGYFGLWLQMVVVIALGVMFSTFLNGPVAMKAAAASVLGGIFSAYMAELAAGKAIGGGPFESFIRIITQQNMITELDPGLQTNAALMADRLMQGLLWLLASVLPQFGSLDFVDHVAYGFDIGGGLFWQCVLRTTAFVLPVFVAGYLFLKMREVAR